MVGIESRAYRPKSWACCKRRATIPILGEKKEWKQEVRLQQATSPNNSRQVAG